MSVYEDYMGTVFSVQALRMYQDIANVQIIVLDNSPNTEEGRETKNFVNACSDLNITYVSFEENTGTTQTRQRLFSHATGDLVLVMDCHVLLHANAIAKLKAFWDSADEDMKKNLFTGPLIMDSLKSQCSHFECEWRSEMWGTWATAWRSPKGELLVGKEIDGNLHMKHLNTDGPFMRSDIPWPGHERKLIEKGFKVAGWDSSEQPFEVPAQGLGMFISSKEHWLGFNKDFRHFGGEECYIHEKYRQAGRKTLCLPFMKWWHRFGRPGGPKYPITREAKLRNYILGFQELGLDLEPVRKHFVDEVGVKQQVWDYMIQDPVNFDPYNNPLHTMPPNTAPQNITPELKSNFGMLLPLVAENLHTMATYIAAIPRDLNEHASTLMSLASECDSVLEMTTRRESTMFLAAGLTRKQACAQPQCQTKCQGVCRDSVKLVSFQAERDSLLELIKEAAPLSPGKPLVYEDNRWDVKEMPSAIPGEFDMLFLDSIQTYTRLLAELTQYGPQVKKYIAIHDTLLFGMKGSDEGPGLFQAIKTWLAANPSWFISFHTTQQFGLTVLSCDPAKKPETPIVPWPRMDKDGKPCGVGAEIKGWLKLAGYEASGSCPCNALAAAYNAAGPAWCRDNIEQILDDLKKQADARNQGFLFIRPVMKRMVMKSIRDVEKAIAAGTCS